MKINRRDFTSQLGALALARRFWTQPAFADVSSPLQRLAADKGLIFGSCLALKYFAQSPFYQQLFLEQCDVATPEIHMKWSALSSQPGVYNFETADSLVTFCLAHRIKVRGHTLVWHDAVPASVLAALSPATGQAFMTEHIRKVAGHFAGQLYSWDVVNEVLDPGSQRADGLRDTHWLQNCGVDYIETAFRCAAAADPMAMLVWNENYLELSNGFGRPKRSAMLTLLDKMLAGGVPIQGIGIEAHLQAEQAGVLGDESYEAFLAELAGRGMKIFITELDVQDFTLPADPQARDQAVAGLYRKFLTATLRQPAVKGILTWGLADCFSWIAGYRPRQDGLPVRPLPFDAECKPKAAYYAVAESFESAAMRT
jgi:endo-1,4-beta-xylanase